MPAAWRSRPGLSSYGRDRKYRRQPTHFAETIRSKNAGVDRVTFDVIFRDRRTYDAVRRSGALSREAVLALYGTREARVIDFVEVDPAHAIKFTIARLRPSGSPGDSDIFGAQQHVPLLDIEVVLSDSESELHA